MASVGEAVMGVNTYGKTNVRFLRVVKDSNKHEVFELTGWSQLEGPFEDSYTAADNTKLVPTETQKNSFYALSKKYPMDPLERWVVNFGKDILGRHAHIRAVNVGLDRNPFNRIVVKGREHNHAFQKGSQGIRFVSARVPRNGTISLRSGFRELQVMKTTQSGFENFIKDEYTTLEDSRDRVMATKVFCEWTFTSNVSVDSLDFNGIADSVQMRTLEYFAGDAEKGTYSASVQHTLYEIGKAVLKEHQSIASIRFELPNIHYYKVDFSKFKTNMTNSNEVFSTFDGAAGLIKAEVVRKHKSSL